MPRTEPMYNNLCKDFNCRTVVRNIRVDYHAHMYERVVGNVYRCAHDTMMEVYDVRRRFGKQLSWRIGSDLKGRIKDGHHHGKDRGIPVAHRDARFVYSDVCKMHWATVGDIAFQGFVWPFEAKQCKSIVRALFSKRCRCAVVLVVRGRCFSSQFGRFASNMILENLLWHWRLVDRFLLVYKEGCAFTGGGDPVPKWLVDSKCYCSDFCQCNLVGQGQGFWHHFGQLFSNVSVLDHAFDRSCGHCIFKCDCDHSQVKGAYPPGSYNKHSKNQVICNNLCTSLANAPGFEPFVPIEYHLYQYQNKGWDQVVEDQFCSPSWEKEDEELRAQRLADWQNRLAEEDQQQRKIVKRQAREDQQELRIVRGQRRVADRRSHRWLHHRKT